jgi:hypothetical protein
MNIHRSVHRIELHLRHAKNYLSAGEDYTSDLAEELASIARIASEARAMLSETTSAPVVQLERNQLGDE